MINSTVMVSTHAVVKAASNQRFAALVTPQSTHYHRCDHNFGDNKKATTNKKNEGKKQQSTTIQTKLAVSIRQ